MIVALDQVLWRPLVVVAVCLAWLGTWLTHPGAHEVSTPARWAWTLAFSATAVMVGASAPTSVPAGTVTVRGAPGVPQRV